MLSFWLAFLGISSVSALALIPTDSPTLATSQVSRNISDPLFLPSLTNSTSLSTPLLDRQIQWQCGWTWGGGDFGSSCNDALRYLAFVPGSGIRQFTWGPRYQAGFDVPMPQRVASSDGNCAIQANLVNGRGLSARASQLQVKHGAVEVINRCMNVQRNPTGGRARNINDDANIEVSVTVNRYIIGECYGTMPPFAEVSCRYILDHMLVSEHYTTFGPSSDPRAGNVPLPYALISADRGCVLTITSTGPEDRASWRSIWAGAVQLAGVCARQGKQGREPYHGENFHLSIELGNPPADVSSS